MDSYDKRVLTALVSYNLIAGFFLILDIVRNSQGTPSNSYTIAVLFPITIITTIASNKEGKIKLNSLLQQVLFLLAVSLTAIFVIRMIIG